VRIVFSVVLCRSLIVPLSFGHYIVYPSSIYSFRLPLWYLQAFLKHYKNLTKRVDKVKAISPSSSNRIVTCSIHDIAGGNVHLALNNNYPLTVDSKLFFNYQLAVRLPTEVGVLH
jgi:hypothetical protein